MLCLHCMVNNVLMLVEWDKRQISENTMYINSLLVRCAHTTIFGVSPGLRCHKTHWKVVFLVLIRWFDDILFLPYFKIGEYIGILFMKIVCKQPKMAQLHCHQHFEINRLSLKTSGYNIVYRTRDIKLHWKWHRYPALNGFQKAKSIQCYTRQIMSELGQRKQISNKKGSLVN